MLVACLFFKKRYCLSIKFLTQSIIFPFDKCLYYYRRTGKSDNAQVMIYIFHTCRVASTPQQQQDLKNWKAIARKNPNMHAMTSFMDDRKPVQLVASIGVILYTQLLQKHAAHCPKINQLLDRLLCLGNCKLSLMKLYKHFENQGKMINNVQPFGNFHNAPTQMKQKFPAFSCNQMSSADFVNKRIGLTHKIKLSIEH